jgi:hypothetical protein
MEGYIDLKTLSAATLRQLLSEAEARERHDFERERLDPAHGLPVHLRSIARALPPVLSARQARNVFKVSAITLRRWIETGKLNATQHGEHGKVLITRDSILLLLGSQKGTENEP